MKITTIHYSYLCTVSLFSLIRHFKLEKKIINSTLINLYYLFTSMLSINEYESRI